MAMKVNDQWYEGRAHVWSNLNKPIAAQQMPVLGHALTKFIKEAYIHQNCCYVKMENIALKGGSADFKLPSGWTKVEEQKQEKIVGCLHAEVSLSHI